MKNKPLLIGIIVALIVAVLGITILFVKLILDKFDINYYINSKASDVLVYEKVYDNDFDNISIEVNAGKIYINENEDNNNFKLYIYGDEDRTTVEDDDKNLFIKSNIKKCNFFCFNRKVAKVVLYVPKDYSGSIKIDNQFGDNEIESLENASVNIELSAGDIKINKVNKATIDLKAGDLKINKVNNLKANVKLGDIDINSINGTFDIKGNAGDITISDVDIEEDSYINLNLGDIEIKNTNKIYVDAKNDLGDIDINNNYRDSKVVLKIRNNLGDIEVDN